MTSFPDPEAGDRFFFLIHQAGRLREMALAEDLAPSGVGRWRILRTIRDAPACTMQTLARLCAVDRTTLTRILDQFVREGLVDRWTPPRDRRQTNLALTAKGEAACRRASEALAAYDAEVLGSLDPDRLQGAISALEACVARLAPDPRTAAELLEFGRRRRA